MSSTSALAIQRLRHLDRDSSEFYDRLGDVLRGDEYKRYVSNPQGDSDAAWLVDYLDSEVLNSSGIPAPIFQECIRELRRICGTRVVLPTSWTLEPSLLAIDGSPVASGGPGDIYRGALDGLEVCVKRVRVYSKDSPEKVMRIYQGAVVWKHMVHKNVLPLLCITSVPLQLISEWMPGGDLQEYIRRCPSSDRLELLRDITEGLNFLHSLGVVHGDLKGSNVLVDHAGHARITDLALTMVTTDDDSVHSSLKDPGHTARWTAPEILTEEGMHSKQADVFSFAMVMSEVFTGAVPFKNSPPTAAMLAIMNGRRPPRPKHPGFTDELWALMRHCWAQDPHSRPEISEVLDNLQNTFLPLNEGQVVQAGPAEEPSTLIGSHPSCTSHESGGRGMNPEEGIIQKLSNQWEDVPLPTSISRLHQLDRLIADERDKLLHDEKYIERLAKLNGDELVQVIDYLSDTHHRLVQTGGSPKTCLHVLRKICGTRKVLPSACKVFGTLSPLVGSHDIREGFLDAQKGSLSLNADVCVKNFYTPSGGGEALPEEFYKEVVTWKHLKHPNIVPFIGVTLDPPHIISEWMPGGELKEYMKGNALASPINLLLGVARGLAYLHSCDITHGNLKGPNVVVDVSGSARITDFCFTTITRSPSTAASRFGEAVQSFRWAAPEILRHGAPATKKSDMFSYAMVVFEVFSGTVPFSEIPSPLVPEAIIEGVRPIRPLDFRLTDALWNLTQSCWNGAAKDRPEIGDVVGKLEIIAGNDALLLQGEPEEPHTAEYASSSMMDPEPSQHLDESVQDQNQVAGGPALPLQLPALFSTNKQTATPDARRQKKRGLWYHLKGRLRNLHRLTPNRARSPEEADLTPQQQKSGIATPEERVANPPIRKKWAIWQRLRNARNEELRPRSPDQLISRSHDTTADDPTPPPQPIPSVHPSEPHLPYNASQSRCNVPRLPLSVCLNDQSGARPELAKTRPSGRELRLPSRNQDNGVLRSRVDGDSADKGEGGDRSVAEGDFMTDRGTSQDCVTDRPNCPAWRQLTSPGITDPERISLFTATFSDSNTVKNLSPGEAQPFIDAVHEVFCGLPQDCFPREVHRRCVRSLYKVCGRHAVVPESMRIPLCYTPSETPCCDGGFADVWKGIHDGKTVAAKALRVYKSDNLVRIRKRFCREVVTWKTLRHPNVLPLIGVTMEGNRLVMVSEWMKNGSIIEFLKTESNADRLGLLGDVAKGIIYMHDRGIVHGDLKGDNILINSSGRACIADFSLVTVVTGKSGFIFTSLPVGGTIPWMSPELLDPEKYQLKKGHPTKESDCYALGMVIYEVLSGKTPFFPCKNPLIVWKILQGENPEIPEGEETLFTHTIRRTLDNCWKRKPSERMTAENILRGLEGDPSAFSMQSHDAARVSDDTCSSTSDDSSDDDPERAESPDYIPHDE